MNKMTDTEKIRKALEFAREISEYFNQMPVLTDDETSILATADELIGTLS